MPQKTFPGDLSVNTAYLVGGWVVGPLYGINICVYILCFHVLQKKGMRGPNLMMFVVSSVQFGLATGHVITIVVQLVRGFIGAAGTLDGPSLRLEDQSTPENLAQQVLYVTNSLIGDAILIWRFWIIWNRNTRLCAPFAILWLATTVTGYTALGLLGHFGTVFVPQVHSRLVATWALSITTQLGATLLIVYRIWKSIRWSSMGIRASRVSVLWILVESGALYTTTTIFLLGFLSTNIGAVFAAALGQISSLAPTLIIVRAGLKSQGPNSSFNPAKGSINNTYHPSPPPQLSIRIESGSPEDDPVVVHIKKGTEIRLDDMMPGDIGKSLSRRSSSATSPKLKAHSTYDP